VIAAGVRISTRAIATGSLAEGAWSAAWRRWAGTITKRHRSSPNSPVSPTVSANIRVAIDADANARSTARCTANRHPRINATTVAETVHLFHRTIRTVDHRHEEPPAEGQLAVPFPVYARPMRSVTWPAGWSVTWVAETGSTNADLFAAAMADAPDRTVLAADHQTAGRGRLDRRWEAPPGSNLLVSLLLRDVPDHPQLLSQRVALAALSACGVAAGVEPTVKWPNDIMLHGRKLAGVLAQSGTSVSGPFVVCGIGINVGWAPEGAARLGDAITPKALLRTLLEEFDAQPADVGALYRAHLATVGQQVRVELPGDRVLVGRAVDVEPDGRLVVLDECAISHRLDTGDVVHLRSIE
jgi:BirA family transcriptional regulator, biotin operon repressor / biotin---[acetyl-CoA-carboxylase] ligase